MIALSRTRNRLPRKIEIAAGVLAIVAVVAVALPYLGSADPSWRLL